ncbi:acidic mammalian chitinase-like isoform X2 [Harmonia axyridis]|uniref:acidic mammalian chitinase-like isoform X2 n=1 Tax=Harmonia axyridis TaxID=115357 RepID=UPI001E275CF2|nr:acidic mammalian chitinase-like isoform X2 [Harmonia axyridis]
MNNNFIVQKSEIRNMIPIFNFKNTFFLDLAFILIYFILPSSSVLNKANYHDSKRVVCYYSFPSSYYSLQPVNINTSLCTHILVGFLTVNDSVIVISKEQEKIMKEVVILKKTNANLKIMLSVGGGGGTFGFPEMVQTSENRAKFIQSIQHIVEHLDLDGVDLDWEFPNDLFNNEKVNFIHLLQDIRQNINNSMKKYLISVAVAAPITIVEVSYNIPEINRLVDFVNIMSYDYNFYSWLTPWTGMNAPLYARSNEFFYFATQNINYTSNYWVRKGLNKEKINIGLPVYAHTYKLKSAEKTYLGAPAIGNGVLGVGGSAKYGAICEFMKSQNLTPVFDKETKSPYVTNGTEWVSFENEESIKYKTEFVLDNGFGGVMVFSLNSDDFEGKCKTGDKFPNTKLIHKIFLE